MRALSLSLLLLLFSSTTFCAAFETAADRPHFDSTDDPYDVTILQAIIALLTLEKKLEKNNSIHIDRWSDRRELGPSLFGSLEYSIEVLAILEGHIRRNPLSERKEDGLIEIDCILERCIIQLECGYMELDTLYRETIQNPKSRHSTLVLFRESLEQTEAFYEKLKDYHKLVRTAYLYPSQFLPKPYPEPRQQLPKVLEKEKAAEINPTQFITSRAVPKPQKKSVFCAFL